MFEVVVDQERCVGCGFCLDVCDPGVLDTDDGHVVPFDLEDCTGCALCEDCPEGAITVKKG